VFESVWELWLAGRTQVLRDNIAVLCVDLGRPLPPATLWGIQTHFARRPPISRPPPSLGFPPRFDWALCWRGWASACVFCFYRGMRGSIPFFVRHEEGVKLC